MARFTLEAGRVILLDDQPTVALSIAKDPAGWRSVTGNKFGPADADDFARYIVDCLNKIDEVRESLDEIRYWRRA